MDPVSPHVIAAALDVHRELGPGLLESAYTRCLAIELSARGVPFRREVPVPVFYKGTDVEVFYRADFIVADRVLLEVKSVQKIDPIHRAHLLTYLKLTRLRIGLLLNFNCPMLRTGMYRLVL